MGQRIYEFAIIYTPLQTEEQRKQGVRPKSELVCDVARVLADDDKQAQMIAARAIPDEYVDRLAQVEVAIRPF